MSEEARPNCEICGEPMPEGEEMFNYHGYSGPCPKPPLGHKGSATAQTPEWKKCPQCKRENTILTWARFGGKCPNCNDLHDREFAPPVETPTLKTVTDHKYISLICHESGCQNLVLIGIIKELLDMSPLAKNPYEKELHARATETVERLATVEGVRF